MRRESATRRRTGGRVAHTRLRRFLLELSYNARLRSPVCRYQRVSSPQQSETVICTFTVVFAGRRSLVVIGISIHFQSAVLRNRERGNRLTKADYGFDR